MTTTTEIPSHYTKILDHGFVGLVDHMGDDASIVRAARTSIAGLKVKATQDARTLLRYLFRNRHTGPFEMVEFIFHAKMPIFVARQWVRHRTASINEMSARYGELPEEFFVPAEMRAQSTSNRQGSEGVIEEDNLDILIERRSRDAFGAYHRLLEAGTAREIARTVLPLGTYTEWYWKIDLHNLLHFLQLRLHPHAQPEIRVFAEAMANMVLRLVPLTWEAFEDYRLHAMTLSRQEIEFIAAIYGDKETQLHEIEGHFGNKREAAEFLAKLARLGFSLPEAHS